MEPEQKRIKIAEACGWKIDRDPDGTHWFQLDGDKVWVTICEIPDYITDLNAMHEAEKALNEEQMIQYTSFLFMACDDWRGATIATAAQRAESFLKTLNLYK